MIRKQREPARFCSFLSSSSALALSSAPRMMPGLYAVMMWKLRGHPSEGVSARKNVERYSGRIILRAFLADHGNRQRLTPPEGASMLRFNWPSGST